MLFASYAVVLVADTKQPTWLTNAAQNTGNTYREVVANILNNLEATKQLEDILNKPAAENATVRQARILLARQQHPQVFVDYEALVKKMRKSYPHGERPGFLSGTLLQFTKHEPENKFVDEYERDENGKIRFAERSGSTNIFRGMRAVRKKVEKYTDSEVAAGIAKNAAARQAVLEHFLKFLDDGDVYEQSEMVELVNRLWGRERIKRMEDLAVIDNVPDADALIEAVFKDGSRPEVARMSAAYCLPNSKRLEVRAFMMGVVTNNPAEYKQSYDVVDRALVYLESGADANELTVLKSQTNAPAWKLEKITKTSRAIESRLSAASHGK